MMRILTAGVCAMVATLLLSSDASACGKRRAASSATPCYPSGTAYGGGATPGSYGSSYGYDPGYTSGYGTAPGYGYGGYDFGRPGYNPGGLGGPASGLGVRPGAGVGGYGPRR